MVPRQETTLETARCCRTVAAVFLQPSLNEVNVLAATPEEEEPGRWVGGGGGVGAVFRNGAQGVGYMLLARGCTDVVLNGWCHGPADRLPEKGGRNRLG